MRVTEVTEMKFIGMRNCGDCIDAESVLKQASVPFEYVDIAAEPENLREFILLRDSRPEFDKIKANGYVGIPCFVMDDGRILFDENKVLADFNEKEDQTLTA